MHKQNANQRKQESKKQSLKPVYVTTTPSEIVRFCNQSKTLTIRQCVRLRLLASRIEYRQQSI
ncbi:hypothetical protein [Vibrio cholerae]|uniref:hypothetical protein n=1 Tax=Vibrio cholerae TaxID=666 RepID=UPI0011D8EA1F|nr:hypothetical protein [Vibrio cholerae]TXX48331.1 hypothetical protein FXF14_10965 [Vibrio cholerae]